MFLDLLGLPTEELPQFLEWNYVILHVQDDEQGGERQRHAAQDIAAYLADHVQRRKADPGDDMVSSLLAAEVEGERLTDDDVVAMAMALFMAGLDTVTSALGWIWRFLALHPAHRRQVRDDPSIIPSAVEELLRYHSFVSDGRVLAQDVEFAAVTMKAGDRIMLPTAAAGRDPRQFPDPHVVDFHREPNRHLAFAAGPHRCVGAHLARFELRTVAQAWHERIPEYRIPEGARVTFHGGAVAGPDTLPLVLTP